MCFVVNQNNCSARIQRREKEKCQYWRGWKLFIDPLKYGNQGITLGILEFQCACEWVGNIRQYQGAEIWEWPLKEGLSELLWQFVALHHLSEDITPPLSMLLKCFYFASKYILCIIQYLWHMSGLWYKRFVIFQ